MVSIEKDHGSDYNSIKNANEGFHRLTNAFGLSPTATVITSPEGLIEYANPVFLSTGGYSEEDIKHNNHFAYFFDDDSSARLAGEIIPHMHSAKNWTGEMSLRRKDGSEYAAEMFCSIIVGDDGEPAHFLFNLYDITKHKKNEEDLKQSEEKYRNIFENSVDGIFQSTIEGKLVKINPSLARIFGYSSTGEMIAEVKDLGLQVYAKKEDRDKAIAILLREGLLKDFEVEGKKRNGEKIWITLNAKAVRDGSGKTIFFEGITEDITEHKKAEEALLASHGILDGIINTIPVRVFWKDRDLKYLGCNTIFAKDAGRSEPKELIGKDDYQMGWRDQAELYRADDRQVIESGRSKILIEEPQTTPDGKTIVLLTSKMPLRGSDGKIIGVLGTYMDITERKKAEDALIESEKKLRETQELAHLGFWRWDVKSGNVEWSAEVFKIFGLDPKEFSPRIDSIQALSPWPEDNKRDEELIRKATESHDAGTYEQRFLRPDKSIGHYVSTFQGRYDDTGKLSFIVGTVQDITERKRAEEALRISESRFREVALNISGWVWEVDSLGRYTYCSENVVNVLGYSVEEMLSKTPFDLMSKEETARVGKIFSELAAGKKPIKDLENLSIAKDGREVLLLTNGVPILDKEGNLAGYRGVDKDITERKKVEGALRQSEEKYHSLVENINDVIFSMNEKGTFTYVSSAVARILKYDPQVIIGQQFTKFVYPEDVDKVREYFKNDLLGKTEPHEYRIIDGIGDVRYVRISTRQVYEKGVPAGIMGVITDLTKRKRTEEKLQEQYRFMESLMDTIPSPLFYKDLSGICIGCNKAFAQYLGQTREEIIGRSVYDNEPKEHADKYVEKDRELLENPGKQEYEGKIYKKDGTLRDVIFNKASYTDSSGKVAGLIGVISDITDLKNAEEAMGIEVYKFKVLYELALNMQEKTLDENLQFITDKARELLNSDTAYIGLCTEDHSEMYMHTLSGIKTDAFKNIRLPYGKGLGWLVMQTNRGYIIDDYYKDHKINHVVDRIIAEEGLVSGMAVPIHSGQGEIGVLYVYNRTKVQYTEDDLRTLMILGNLATIEISSKRSQQALEESRQHMADIINFLPDATLVIDKDRVVIAWNKAMEELTGLKAENITGKGDYEYGLPFYGEKRPIFIDLVGKSEDEIKALGYSSISKSGDTIFGETRTVLKGKKTLLWLKASPIYDNKGQRVGSIESMRDITSRRAMEDALKDRNALLNSVINSAKDTLIFALDREYRYVTYNTNHSREMKKVYGADISIGKCMLDYMLPEVKPLAKASYDRVLNGESFTEVQKQSNQDIWYEFSWNPTLSAEGKITGINVFVRDITERKKTEEKIENLASFPQLNPAPVLEINPSGIVSFYNQASTDILKNAGLKEDVTVFLPVDLDRLLSDLETEKESRIVYREIRIKDRTFGENVHLLKKPKGIRIYAYDLTERMKAEEALKRSQNELLFKNILLEGQSESSIDGILVVDHSGKTIQSNRRFVQMWNISQGVMDARDDEAMIKSVLSQLKDPDKFVKKVMYLYDHIEEKSKDEVEFIDGKTFERYSSPLTDPNGKNLGRIWYFHDITSRKKAEDALEDSHRRITTVLDSIDSLVYVADLNSYELLFLNKFGRDIFGDKLGQKCWQAIQKGQTGPCSFCTNDKLVSDTGIPTGVYRWEFQNTVNGRCYDCRDQAIPWTGKELVRMEIATDITEQKKAEKLVLESSSMYRALIETTNTGYVIVDDAGKVIDANPEYVRLTGHSALDEIRGKSVVEWTAEYEKEKNNEAVAKCARDGYIKNFEVDYVDKFGKITPIEVNAKVTVKDDKPQILTLCRDITERRKAGEELKESKDYLNSLIGYANAPIIVFGPKKEITIFNHASEALSGYTANEVIGKTVDMLFPEKERTEILKDVINPVLGGKKLEVVEVPIRNKNGAVKNVLWNSANIYDANGKLQSVIAQGQDITERKKSEDELKESKRRLTDIIDFLPDATFVVNTEGIVIAWNKAIEEMTGVKAENMVGKENYEYALCFYNERRPMLIDLVLKPSPENEKKYSMFKSSSKAIVAEAHSSFLKKDLWNVSVALYDAKGNITGAIESIKDVTEQKKVENALINSETKFKTFFNSASDSVFIIDPEGRILEANQVACDVLGYNIDEIKNLCLESITGEGIDFFKERLKNTLDSGSVMFEGMHIRKNGTPIPVEINTRAIDFEGKKAVLSICRDITERRKTEEKLRIAYNDLNDELKRQEAISKISSVYLSLEEFEEGTKKVLRIIGEVSGLSRVCIFENDPDGKSATNTFAWVSKDASPIPDGQKIVSFDELPSFNKLMHEKGAIMAPDVAKLPNDLSNALLARGIKSIFILPLSVNNESYGYINFSETREQRDWDYSDIILLTTVSHIISEAFERKISDEQLNRRNEEVEKSAQVIMNFNKDLKAALEEQKRLEKIKTEFLSVTSHELRTPITPMKAQLQMVLGQYFGTLTKEQKTSLEMVLRNATRLDHLICDILDISKLESGNMKFIISTADLNELVRNAVETLKYNANEKNIAMDIELGSIPLMSLDKDRITQVVMNLITNAVKFTDPGGRITIKTIGDKDKAIVEVSDSGIGMKEEDMKRLFTPFFQVDSSRSRNHEGTGLGLAICKGVVINHGGEINVRSTPGKGSTFSFTLPYNETISTKVVREVELFKLK
jgi:PAS domain S-box-containing protein